MGSTKKSRRVRLVRVRLRGRLREQEGAPGEG
jgi:hypothetical protein